MEIVFVASAVFGHPIVAASVAALLARDLKKKNALRFPLSTALAVMLAVGALIGACFIVNDWMHFNALGVMAFLTPLPFWIAAAIMTVALKRRLVSIDVLSAFAGVVIGTVVHSGLSTGIILIGLMFGIH